MARPDDTVSSVVDYLDDWSNANFGESHISSVVDFWGSQIDVNERHLARLDEIRKLDEDWRSFTVRDRKTLPRDLKIFRHTWVDKCTEGVCKARLTCADVKPKGKQSAGDSAFAQTNNFCPTPHKASAKLIELKSLLNSWPRAKADLSSAFLIARDGGDQDGQPTFLWPPREWLDTFERWLSTKSAVEQKRISQISKSDLVWQLDGNLYGRQAVAAEYRSELENILLNKVSKTFSFQRGKIDACVYRCRHTGLTFIHHIDDFDLTGPEWALKHLLFNELLKFGCKLKVGTLSILITMVRVLRFCIRPSTPLTIRLILCPTKNIHLESCLFWD